MNTRGIILLFLCLVFFLRSTAQIRTESFYPYGPWTLSGGSGYSELYGDLNHSNSGLVYFLGGARNINQWVSVNLELMQGTLSAYEMKNHWTDGLSVINQFSAADITGRVSLGEFFNYPQDFFQKIIFGLYAGSGIGYMSNNVSNITVKFKNRDKLKITDFNSSNIHANTSNFFIPINVGINLHLTRRFFFNVNYQFSYAFSDYVDGYNFQKPTATNNYNDMFSVLTFGLNFYLGKVGSRYYSTLPMANADWAITPAEQKLLLENADADGDGVPDRLDKCPGTPAGVQVDANGCPLDRDGDGIPDYLDKCPDVKGIAALNGCPEPSPDMDSDGDGVPDRLDKCPGTPAGVKVDANGCPLDRDGDGVPDYLDKCPDVKGPASNNGCPAVDDKVKKVLDQAVQGIQFETGKDIIQTGSYPIVDNVVKVMKDNPSYKLQINGYTDNRGKPEANKTLSNKRAIAVMKYLQSHGIDGSRLKAAGYGQEKPVSDNNTEEGRKQNRRVELIIGF